jgi:hypothetical protein
VTPRRALDLSAIPLIDGHCHSIFASFQESPVTSFLHIFTEAADECLLADSRYAGVPIVLLHMGYPYVRESAFLANLYPDVYVDLSLALPLLRPVVPQLMRELLALAPAIKLLYGSDAHSQPEMFWLRARYDRWSLGKILTDWIDDDTLEEHEALEIAQRICFRNALELYRLDSSWLGGATLGLVAPR